MMSFADFRLSTSKNFKQLGASAHTHHRRAGLVGSHGVSRKIEPELAEGRVGAEREGACEKSSRKSCFSWADAGEVQADRR